MIKLLFSSFLLCILVAATTAAVAKGSYKDPAHPGKCVVKGVVLTPGEHSQQPSSCGRMICSSDGSVEFHSCGAVAPPPGHKLGDPIMPTANYPDCCRKAFIPII